MTRWPGALDDPGRAHPRQQVDVGLVLGQHHRTVGQVGDGLADIGDDLLGVRGALGDQPGPPPGGDLAHAPVQSPQAHGGAAQVQVQQPDRPRLGVGEQPADPCAQPPATQAWPAGSGPVGQRVRTVGVVAAHRARVAPEQLGDGHGGPALLGEQDHHQPQPDPVRAVQQPEQVTGVASRAGSLGVHAGGRILARAS
jgi:hypothetical protein